MTTKDTNKLLKDIKRLRHPKPIGSRPRKRKNESDRDYIFRINGFKCRYSKRKVPKSKLSLITLHPNRTDLPKWKNLGCCLTEYALLKGGMGDNEFKKYLSERKKEVRKEAHEYSQEIKKAVFERYDFKCIYCEYELGYTPKGRKLTIDHKIPVSKGGTNDMGKNFKNLTCACEQHNFDKRDLTAVEYFKILEKKKNKR